MCSLMYSTDKFLIGRRVVCMAVITSMFGIQIRSGTSEIGLFIHGI